MWGLRPPAHKVRLWQDLHITGVDAGPPMSKNFVGGFWVSGSVEASFLSALVSKMALRLETPMW